MGHVHAFANTLVATGSLGLVALLRKGCVKGICFMGMLSHHAVMGQLMAIGSLDKALVVGDVQEASLVAVPAAILYGTIDLALQFTK
jgi:hypothetical protein